MRLPIPPFGHGAVLNHHTSLGPLFLYRNEDNRWSGQPHVLQLGHALFENTHMTANEARKLIRYTGWASRKVMAAALQLTMEELERPNAVSHGSIAGTLAHIYLADRVWQERMIGSDAPLVWNASLAEAEAAWPGIQRAWEAWADGLSDGDLERSVHYKSINGNPAANTAGEIVTHVVNHATLHRGQVVGMIRQLGGQPPATDFIFYLRELATAP